MQLRPHVAGMLLSAILAQAGTIGPSIGVYYVKDLHLGETAALVSSGVKHPFYTLTSFITAPNGTVLSFDRTGLGFRQDDTLTNFLEPQDTNLGSTCAPVAQVDTGAVWKPDVVGTTWAYSYNLTLFYSANNTYTTKTIDGQPAICMSKPYKAETVGTGPHKFTVHPVGEALPSGTFTSTTVTRTQVPSGSMPSMFTLSLGTSTSVAATSSDQTPAAPSGAQPSSTDAGSPTATTMDTSPSSTGAAPSPSDSPTDSATPTAAPKSHGGSGALTARSLLKRDPPFITVLAESWQWSPAPTGQAYVVSGALASRSTSLVSYGSFVLSLITYLTFV